MTSRWLIRVASDRAAAAGHVSRCRVLARALGAGNVTFALDREGGAWQASLEQEGFGVEYHGALSRGPWRGGVLDTNRDAAAEATELQGLASPVVVLADNVAPPRSAALFVNSAPGLHGDTVDDVPALLGPRYALIRPEFAQPAQRAVGSVRCIVVTFGGLDAGNATGKVLRALEGIAWLQEAPRVVVVLGSGAKHLVAVRAQVDASPLNASLRVDATDFPEILADADLVVGAGGVSLLERMAAGVPSLTIVTAPVTASAVAGAARLGGTVALGERDALSVEEIASSIEQLVYDRSARTQMAKRARDAVDGRGAERVAARMSLLAAGRPATMVL